MKLFHKIGAWVSVLPILLLPATAFAQLSKSETLLTDVGSQITEDTGLSFPELVGSFIRVILGILGIVFVVYVVYAGYLWMTASGEKEKVEKSKKLLGQAIIGIIIIVAAYAISAFVIEQIVAASKGV